MTEVRWMTVGIPAPQGSKRHVGSWSLTEVRHIEQYRRSWLDKNLYLAYPTDGIVVKINDYEIQQTRPDYWQMAIKY